MAPQGRPPVTLAFRIRPEFAAVLDELAQRRNLNRSQYLRTLVRDDALRCAAVEAQSDDTD